MQAKVNISIVLYNNSFEEVQKKIEQYNSWDLVNGIIIVDNSPKRMRIPENVKLTYYHRPDNPGYGAGHNLAITQSVSTDVEFHLVVNLDVHFEEPLLEALVDFIATNDAACIVQPSFIFPDGTTQKLAKYLPSLVQMALRMIGLGRVNWWNIAIDTDQLTVPFPCPYLSGCFLLMRCRSVMDTGMFDERYFMYPEDIDLSRRYASIKGAWVVPTQVACHEYGGRSKKSLKMFLIHLTEVLKYYKKWGFVWDVERKRLNAITKSYTENHK